VAESSTSTIGSTAPGHYGAGKSRLELGELTIRAAWNIQGKADRAAFVDEVRRVFAVELPSKPNTTTRSDALTAFWLGPESWLLVAHGAPRRFDFPAERDAINAAGGALFDVSAGRVAYSIRGNGAAALLARRCPLDFHPSAFPVEGCAQSLLGHVGALFYRSDADTFVVMVARSFARDAWHALCVSAAADGYDVAPTAIFV
jgi:sarcosine oxidase, subunit gamma